MLLKAGTRLDFCGDASKGHWNLYRPLWNRIIPLIMALRARENSTRVGYDRFGYNLILESGMGSGVNTQF
ncbi:hypothetical protein Hanom_Chr05g00402601 [Helianthus anomalus]